MSFSRRQVLHAGLVTAAASMARFAVADSSVAPQSAADEKLFARLDQFVEQYMREMHSPGVQYLTTAEGHRCSPLL
ncbi:MAG: hypothetical protein SXG53_15415, partial [Pseudomonadota bacterium]|nr:hypothetical protein [Pseudomonadota bacterium]